MQTAYQYLGDALVHARWTKPEETQVEGASEDSGSQLMAKMFEDIANKRQKAQDLRTTLAGEYPHFLRFPHKSSHRLRRVPSCGCLVFPGFARRGKLLTGFDGLKYIQKY